MYYHASKTAGIKMLEPRVSEHGVPLVYFSKKRENVLIYLSNAVEKYCRETGFEYSGSFSKWGPYGFGADGRLRLEEYYPDALVKTYSGVSGYIYRVDHICPAELDIRIPDAAVSAISVKVTSVEFVPDAYEAILDAERRELITVLRFKDLSDRQREWIGNTICKEYAQAADHPEYRFFLRENFPWISFDII